MLTSLRLQNVRSYDDTSFEFEPAVNIVVGPNASGKTTVLESIIMLYSGNSFKAKDYELVRTDAPWMRIDGQIAAHVRTIKCVYQSDDSLVKTYELDGTVYKRLPAAKLLPVVLFEPNDLQLLHGSPEGRRIFLDTILSTIDSGYAAALRHYKRVLAQRNSLLKQQRGSMHDQLFVWNLRLSELGGCLAAARQRLIAQFSEAISDHYSAIAGVPTEVGVFYKSSLSLRGYETDLLQKLEKNTELDMLRGFTGVGPHRDDMVFMINGRFAHETASRGEIRTLVLVLKMLEAQFIEQALAKKPLLLLDDVFSELDGRRRQALVAFLHGYQAFITTTDADVVLEHFLGKAHVIALS